MKRITITIAPKMSKASPIRRVKGPSSLTGAWQAVFCHVCEAVTLDRQQVASLVVM